MPASSEYQLRGHNFERRLWWVMPPPKHPTRVYILVFTAWARKWIRGKPSEVAEVSSKTRLSLYFLANLVAMPCHASQLQTAFVGLPIHSRNQVLQFKVKTQHKWCWMPLEPTLPAHGAHLNSGNRTLPLALFREVSSDSLRSSTLASKAFGGLELLQQKNALKEPKQQISSKQVNHWICWGCLGLT